MIWLARLPVVQRRRGRRPVGWLGFRRVRVCAVGLPADPRLSLTAVAGPRTSWRVTYGACGRPALATAVANLFER